MAACSGAREGDPVLAPGGAADTGFELALEGPPGREFREASPCAADAEFVQQSHELIGG